jgi:uncharacterized protein (UPF0335 family)
MKPKPTLGQEVFLLNIGNDARHVPQVLKPANVSKVGRKYFSVKMQGPYPMEREYHVEDWRERTEYSAGTRLYASENEYMAEKETAEICRELRHVFTMYNATGLDLPRLRKIIAIVREARP